MGTKPNNTWIPVWYKIVVGNPLIREGCKDDPFTTEDFYECSGYDELYRQVRQRQAVGAAIYFKDVCFVNQIDDSCDWMVMKKNLVMVHNFTTGFMDKEAFIRFMKRFESKSLEEFWG